MIPAIPSLRILMLAPEPFFEPRGTPFSEYHRIKALVEQGHHVDLVTYPIGANVDLPNLRIIRSVSMPFVKKVPIGPFGDQGVPGRAAGRDRAAPGDEAVLRRHPFARRGRHHRRAGSAAASAFRTSTTCTPACRSS